MIGTQLILIASICSALSNFCMRRSIDSSGSASLFLVVQLLLSFVVNILLNPIRMGEYQWSFCIAAFGAIAGVILGLMMLFLGRSLEYGLPGVTFATVNSASVMPMVLMVVFFGEPFGYTYTIWNGLGAFLVIAGLFWAGSSNLEMDKKGKWLACVTVAFLLHTFGLAILQWRALTIHYPNAEGLLLKFDPENAQNPWFLPMLFFAAFLVQVINYKAKKIEGPKNGSIKWGIFGGIANGAATFFVMLATEFSSSFEHALIFPLYAVGVIVLCNIWGSWLYKENVNWRANIICVLGIFLGMIEWKYFFTPK